VPKVIFARLVNVVIVDLLKEAELGLVMELNTAFLNTNIPSVTPAVWVWLNVANEFGDGLRPDASDVDPVLGVDYIVATAESWIKWLLGLSITDNADLGCSMRVDVFSGVDWMLEFTIAEWALHDVWIGIGPFGLGAIMGSESRPVKNRIVAGRFFRGASWNARRCALDGSSPCQMSVPRHLPLVGLLGARSSLCA
jgi:hypothetical protein